MLPDRLFKTITWDQGAGMVRHVDFTVETGIPIYFCVPHSPWRRGSNENANGIPDIYPVTSEGRTADGNDRDVAKIEPGCQLPGMGLRGSSPARQPFATSVWSPITRGLSTGRRGGNSHSASQERWIPHGRGSAPRRWLKVDDPSNLN
jgi:hypothetical protein